MVVFDNTPRKLQWPDLPRNSTQLSPEFPSVSLTLFASLYSVYTVEPLATTSHLSMRPRSLDCRATQMTVTKESVPMEAILAGEGRERTCRVRVSRRATYPDESSAPICVSYSCCRIQDTDDFPDGNYELSFDDRKVLLRKHAGQYLIL